MFQLQLALQSRVQAGMGDSCRCSEGSRGAHAILFAILTAHAGPPDQTYSPKRCHCDARRTVRLRSRDTCQVAASVLVKTVRFVRSLPAFQQLPDPDRAALLRHCWTPLFVLGLAQEGVDVDVEQEPASSMLKEILLNQHRRRPDGERPTLAAVQNLKSCLQKFWSLDLSPKEYAYLKGTMIFNPDVPGLQGAAFVEDLQREAQHVLREVLFVLRPDDGGSFGRVLLAVASLQSVTAGLVAELFFRPIIGSAHLPHLITDLLFSR